MPKTRDQKQQMVAQMTDKLASAKSVVLTDYQGLTMTQLLELRQKLAEQQAELKVTKNNLLEIALKDAGYPVDNSQLTGSTATLFAFGDEISPLKTLTKSLKEYSIGKVKGGYLNKASLSGAQVQQLADLPSKQELIAKTVNVIGSPLYGIVNVLQANIRNLVNVLDQVQKQKAA